MVQNLTLQFTVHMHAYGLPVDFSFQLPSSLIAAHSPMTVIFHTPLQWSSVSLPSVTAAWYNNIQIMKYTKTF